jgi:hypothetical protein
MMGESVGLRSISSAVLVEQMLGQLTPMAVKKGGG